MKSLKFLFDLPDQALCRGCPLGERTLKCRAGFIRHFAKIEEVRRPQPTPSSMMDYLMSHAPQRATENDVDLNFTFVRPLVCIAAMETDPGRIVGTLARMERELPPQPKTEKPAPGKVES